MTVVENAIQQNSTSVRSNVVLRTAGLVLRATDRLAPALAARMAANLFLTPRRMSRPDRERQWMGSGRREDHVVAGRRIVTCSWGEGPPVLLIHGWEGRGSQLGALPHSSHAQGYRWIGVDLPAHGDSAGRRTNLIEIAEVIRSLVEELDPEAIVAHSFGAAGTTVALSSVPYAGKLVYIAPPEDFNYFTSVFGSMLGITSDLAERMQREIEHRLDVDWSKLRLTALAREMDVPLLIIHDEHDEDVPHRFGKAIAEEWPKASLLTTHGLGHHRILRDENVIGAIVDFISSGTIEALVEARTLTAEER